jgi:cellobiose phosphorylase
MSTGWHFVDERGTFALVGPHRSSYLYFPLAGEQGMISAVTPTLHGDIKSGQNTYLMAPVSAEDLHASRAARNFWVHVEGYGPWSATGNSARQMALRFADEESEQVEMRGGFLWHQVTRTNPSLGLQAQIINLIPPQGDQVELMQVTLGNVGEQVLTVTPTGAIPIFGRSADNLRDHRHVTSLLHRIQTHAHGVLVKPTLSFDERGHQANQVTYAVLGAEEDGEPPVALFPVLEEFIGEGGTLDWPEAVVRPTSRGYGAGQCMDGYEAMGGLRFRTVTLRPDESRAYILMMAISEEPLDAGGLIDRYGSRAQFREWLGRTEAHWEEKLGTIQLDLDDSRLRHWIKWVSLQPILRRLSGNSFLPYHDYGRGGRGWRDLWQDLLALLMMDPAAVPSLLVSNFAGVRTDGSNATIIGSQPGEFKADRNNIPRVWMDHGAWPLLTTQLYIDYSGDLGFLLQEQVYFKDQFINRAQALDHAWGPEDGTRLLTAAGEAYRGTVLEHLLVQHLCAFFNVGEHNIIRLEGADWNDGLDMAPQRGESVAVTALYAGNLRRLSQLVHELGRPGVTEVRVAFELMLLLDTLGEPVSYDSVMAKQARLADYLALTWRAVSGEKATVSLEALSGDLAAKADWLTAHLRRQEWLVNREGYGWFNGYYDNDGNRVEGDHTNEVRMTLTGQTFAIMGEVATDNQAREIVRSANRYLYDPAVRGYRLNSDFGEVLLNLGRCFGFAFGHKENGAMFSHMAVMYANALYGRGLVREGHRVLEGIYQHSQDFPVSRMYPGIPEYFSAKGRGMYPYLTGSASWYLLTMLTQVFGIRGRLGDLILEPKLMPGQLKADGTATALTLFADRRLKVTYHNPARLDHGKYGIMEIKINGRPVQFGREGSCAILPREVIASLEATSTHQLEVMLAAEGEA